MDATGVSARGIRRGSMMQYSADAEATRGITGAVDRGIHERVDVAEQRRPEGAAGIGGSSYAGRGWGDRKMARFWEPGGPAPVAKQGMKLLRRNIDITETACWKVVKFGPFPVKRASGRRQH
jgi:hypothetical protein